MKKKLLVIVLSNFRHDARVRRQVLALKDHYETTVVCFSGEKEEGFEVISITPTNLTFLRKAIASVFLLLRWYSLAHRILHNYYYLADDLSGRNFDIIIANDVETLPIAFRFPGHARVIFDAHEYAPRHFEDKRSWRIFFQGFNTWLCRKYIPKVSGMMTVGKGLAREYEKNFGRRPVVVMNANVYTDIQPSQLHAGKIRLVHHGIATPSRRLELMIEMMRHLDERFTLDLILLKPGFASAATAGYIGDLKQLAANDSRITVRDPVPITQVVRTVNTYDIGVFLLPPINFNYENTLPNKLFDFIQGRLAVAIGPTPEMAEIVEQYHIGVIASDFTPVALAKKLMPLTASDITSFKNRSALAALDLNAEKNAAIILHLVNEVTNA
ncbi:hypothetical protein WBG78_06330 [Chryseolinea sp. T2]|uniref:hypothetical protein n=1 Tax=Chryseolinea sp. T2 TaxID=3129255 RepID=UPI003077B5CF